MTGGRLKRVHDYFDDEPFCFTYGDGVADVNIIALIDHHISRGRKATYCGTASWSLRSS